MTTFGKLDKTISNRARHLGAVALLLAGTSLSLGAISTVVAEPGFSSMHSVSFDASLGFDRTGREDVRAAVSDFITGMTNGDEQTVWTYASEEDQAAFGTEQAVYDAFAEVFPPLADAKTVVFTAGWQEGDTPFVELFLTDEGSRDYRATIGLWLDDAGDWEIVSADVSPATDYVASR